ncbi:MAG: tetraacyldisaccharide 4'-kinase [Burkholderiales bacterium]|nr:tetraacyldisaccharide 4'-kinase [Burkholderiales bacterium]
MSAPELWQHRNLKSLLLLPLAALFAAAAAVRRLAWKSGLLRSRHPGVPVIIVGNITAGGTGKTPLVLWLARLLQDSGMRPAIISRGYGAARSDPRPVTADGKPTDYGDEPCLMAQRAGCPVWVGADRAATAEAVRRAHPAINVILSDDGLQHYRLARDFEIAVIDGARGIGNGWPLPAGPLREPSSRLAGVDAVVINGSDTSGAFPQALPMRLHGDRFRNLALPQQVVTAAHFRGVTVHAAAGIGNPQRFFGHLRELGLDCTEHAFPDHHPYRAADLVFGDDAPVVMTEKDAVKCAAFATDNHWALIVDAEVDARLGELVTARLSQAARHG